MYQANIFSQQLVVVVDPRRQAGCRQHPAEVKRKNPDDLQEPFVHRGKRYLCDSCKLRDTGLRTDRAEGRSRGRARSLAQCMSGASVRQRTDYHCCCTRWKQFREVLHAGRRSGRERSAIYRDTLSHCTYALVVINPAHRARDLPHHCSRRWQPGIKDDNDTHTHRTQRERGSGRMNVGGGWNGRQTTTRVGRRRTTLDVGFHEV